MRGRGEEGPCAVSRVVDGVVEHEDDMGVDDVAVEDMSVDDVAVEDMGVGDVAVAVAGVSHSRGRRAGPVFRLGHDILELGDGVVGDGVVGGAVGDGGLDTLLGSARIHCAAASRGDVREGHMGAVPAAAVCGSNEGAECWLEHYGIVAPVGGEEGAKVSHEQLDGAVTDGSCTKVLPRRYRPMA